MGLRQYVNNLIKELQLGKDVKFRNGLYETDDPEIQAKIERNDAFGVSIHYRDSLEIMERLGRERQEEMAAKRARERQRFLDEMAAEDRAEAEKKAKEKALAEADQKKASVNKKLSAADKVVEKIVEGGK